MKPISTFSKWFWSTGNNNGQLVLIMMSKPTMPITVKRKYCSCKMGCKGRCSCALKNIKCTSGCYCTGSQRLCERYVHNSEDDSTESDSE